MGLVHARPHMSSEIVSRGYLGLPSALRVPRNTVSNMIRRQGREPVDDAWLLGEEVEPQFADLPAQVPGVGLAEHLGLLGEQADETSFGSPRTASA